MTTRLKAFARWLGGLLLAWGAVPVDVESVVDPALLPCPTCNAPWSAHTCPYTVIVPGEHTCSVCHVELPVAATRTHTGVYRCKAHKSIEGV